MRSCWRWAPATGTTGSRVRCRLRAETDSVVTLPGSRMQPTFNFEFFCFRFLAAFLAGLPVSLPPPQSEARTDCPGLTFFQRFSISARTQDAFPKFSPLPLPCSLLSLSQCSPSCLFHASRTQMCRSKRSETGQSGQSPLVPIELVSSLCHANRKVAPVRLPLEPRLLPL